MTTRSVSRWTKLVLLGVLLLGLEGLVFLALSSADRIEAVAQWATQTGDCVCKAASARSGRA